MSVRNIDNSNKIQTLENQEVKQQENKIESKTENKTVEIKNAGSDPLYSVEKHNQRLQGQFTRSRTDLDSLKVQSKIQDSFSLFPLPLPLPLPRIPSPAGMIDFPKTISVLTKALLEGVKNFGLSGVKFGISVAEALGNGAKALFDASQGVTDLFQASLSNLKSSVSGFARDNGRSLSQIDIQANSLLNSSNQSARQVGEAAIAFSSDTSQAVSNLKNAMADYTLASDDAKGRINKGIETLTLGLLGMVTNSAEGLAKLKNGQEQIMKALSDMGGANESFSKIVSENLQLIENAQGRLDSSFRTNVSQLTGDDLKNANSILRSSNTILGRVDRLGSTAESATSNMVEGTEELKSALTGYIDGTWGKLAGAASALSSSITGVNETTKQFTNDTKSFRNTIVAAKAGDSRAINELKNKYGYTLDSLPKAGTQFIDPNFLKGELVNGQVVASKFPTGNASSTAPEINQQLFGNGRTITLTKADGSQVKVSNMADYQKIVAENRATNLGRVGDDGKPMQVHVALEGGGGQGKRFIPAISEMYNNGVVPASVSGTSVGAIAAGVLAAGADPKQVEEIVRDERIAKFLDLGLGGRGGVFKGEEAYKFFDETLRKLTGITDRPVTFADLKIPLHIVAAKYSDTNPPAGQDMSKWENRTFVFGPETTPNTPVALAMRASMAIPGVFDPVEMVDPTTGRTIQLTDGGTLNNLPLGYNKDGLPTVALNLQEPNVNHPKYIGNNLPEIPAPKGNLFASNSLLNTLYGGLFVAQSGGLGKDYQERTNPPTGNFILSVPIWDLQNPKFSDDALDFKYDPIVDARIDGQTRTVTQDFFKQFFTDLQIPGAKGTNIKPLPANTSFTRQVEFRGKEWTASYDGKGSSVTFTSADGDRKSVFVGNRKLENWVIDDAAFGDLNGRLRLALEGSLA
jgi:NTE family protein